MAVTPARADSQLIRPARRSFDLLEQSYRQYLGWIAQAKRPETRARRISQAVERRAQGRKLFD